MGKTFNPYPPGYKRVFGVFRHQNLKYIGVDIYNTDILIRHPVFKEVPNPTHPMHSHWIINRGGALKIYDILKQEFLKPYTIATSKITEHSKLKAYKNLFDLFEIDYKPLIDIIENKALDFHSKYKDTMSSLIPKGYVSFRNYVCNPGKNQIKNDFSIDDVEKVAKKWYYREGSFCYIINKEGALKVYDLVFECIKTSDKYRKFAKKRIQRYERLFQHFKIDTTPLYDLAMKLKQK